MQHFLALATGYLLGAIPSGAVVARLYRRVDLTQVGSRRTGATNVLRTLGPGAAAIVFLGDLLKGSAAVLLAGTVVAPGAPWPAVLAGVAAVIGHCYSPFIGFRGGRGVTTGLGSLAVIAPGAAGAAVLAGAIAIAVTRYVSLGSVVGTAVGALTIVVWTYATGQSPAYAVFGLVLAVFIIAAHHDNIERLWRGTERRLGQRAE